MVAKRRFIRSLLCVVACFGAILVLFDALSLRKEEATDGGGKFIEKHLIPNLDDENGATTAAANFPSKNSSNKQQFCRIPKLEVNGSEVIKFYKKMPPLDCQKGRAKPWVFVDEERKVRATKFAESSIGLSNIICNWSFYNRVSDTELSWTDEENFNFGDKVERGDFVKISCQAGSRQWSNPFMIVAPKEERVKQLRANRQKFNEAARKSDGGDESKNPPPLNVFILSFDSLSQMSFRRNLPKTFAFLEEENFAVFNGYNIVGDGTPQAFIPIFTGKTEEELPLTRKRFPEARYVDEVYPFVWRNFSDAGYATLYGEDEHSLGTFTYRLKGFLNSPTDHFPITFFHYTESLATPRVCIGSEKQHIVWFRYIESFWREYTKLSIPRFSIMHHSILSHDDINRVQQADAELLEHLRAIQRLGAFKDSLLVVMADHGARFSLLRGTHQGQLEERLPFFAVHLPEFSSKSENIVDNKEQHLLRQIWNNIRTNAADRLVTPFDFHAALMDIIKLPHIDLSTTTKNEAKVVNFPTNRAISFLREIPVERTCDQAGIEPHWCTCLDWRDVTGADESMMLAKVVVNSINDYTEPERALCAPLALASVKSAKKLVPNEKLLKYTGVSDVDGFKPILKGKLKAKFATYQIVLITTPGNAEYEVTLFFDGGSKVKVDMKAISHINKYGDTPHCIIDENYFMATFCVCYDKI